jgi:hypothetical protein
MLPPSASGKHGPAQTWPRQTLLGKLQRSPSNAMEGNFCRGMYAVPLAFKRYGQEHVFDLTNRVKTFFTYLGS